MTSGSDAEPGVYFDQSNAREWVAWDYGPGGEPEIVGVYASSLAPDSEEN